MTDSSAEVAAPGSTGVLGPDPGLPIRRWVALLLRLGIGLGLLNAGLAGYKGAQTGTGMPGGPFSPTIAGAFGPLFGALPYIEIILGLALILGFLTTAAAIGAGLYSLVTPLIMTVQIATTGVSTPGMVFPSNPNVAMLMMVGAGSSLTLPGLLANAALIWLSPLQNHPYSIDALIFNQAEPETFVVRTPDLAPEPAGPTSPEV